MKMDFLGLLQNSCRAGGIVHMLEKKKGRMEGGHMYGYTFHDTNRFPMDKIHKKNKWKKDGDGLQMLKTVDIQ